MLHFSPSFPKTNSRIGIKTKESDAIILANGEMSNAFRSSLNWRGSKHRIVLRRRARRVDVDCVVRRIEIEMADARSWLSLGNLRIGIDEEVGIPSPDRLPVT